MLPADDAYSRALSLFRAKRPLEAIDCLQADPDALAGSADALGLMGTVLVTLGRHQDALPFFERSLALDQNRLATLVDMGVALGNLDRRKEAVACYDKALALQPDNAPILNNRAGQWMSLGEPEKALADANRALAIKPDFGSASRYKSRALLNLARPQEALETIDAALALGDLNPDNYNNRACVLEALGRFKESLALFDQAVALAPDEPNHRFARGFLRLLQGDLGGWEDYEHRWKASTAMTQERSAILKMLPDLALNNTVADLAGKRVLVIREQGVGDQMMFAQTLPELIADAASVVYATEPRLQSLFEHSFPKMRTVIGSAALELGPFDRVVPVGSLAKVYRGAPETFSGRPYLSPRPAVTAVWHERLGPKTTPLRIGIAWRGGKGIRGVARSLALEALRPLLTRPDCEFVSLQYGEVENEVAQANQTLPRPIRVFPAKQIDNFEQQAGLIQALDLVISVQQTVVHLSGALGAPCLALLPFCPEWRYGVEGDTMPWYESVRLFRQKRDGDWAPVLAAVGAALDRRAAEGAPAKPAPVVDAYDRALVLGRAGRLQEAVQALRANPAALAADARALGLLGTLCAMAGRLEDAVDAFRRSIALDPGQSVVHSDLGVALSQLGRHMEAAACFDRALALKPDNVAALNNRAGERLNLKQGEEALADADRVLVLKPTLPQAHRNRARALLLLGRPEEALESVAAAGDEANAETHGVRAAALEAVGRFAEALEILDTALARWPANRELLYTRALIRFRVHDFAGGWADYESRWLFEAFVRQSAGEEAASLPRRDLDNRREDVAGKRVLLVAEQGVGDQIMFSSMLPDLAADAAAVTCVTSPRMQSFFETSFPTVRNLAGLEAVDFAQFDRIIPMGSLGRIYRNAAADFPGTPYMKPRAETVAAWAERLGPKTTPLRIGLSWRGGVAASGRPRRSLDLEALRPLLQRRDVEFVSLQYGKIQHEVEASNATLARPIRLFPREETENFEQLAGLVAALDLVVSVQTGLIHVCGAIGAECLVMVPFVANWRYGVAGQDMLWYDSVRLLRQPARDAWAPVIEQVSAALDLASAQGRGHG